MSSRPWLVRAAHFSLLRIRSGNTAAKIAAIIEKENLHMATMDISLKEMMSIEGSVGAAVVDFNSGMALGVLGGSKELDLQVAAAGNTEVVKSKLRTMDSLGLKDAIEDILITLSTQYHIIRPITGRAGKGLFLYLALDRNRANLALARHQLRTIEDKLEV